jgi:hypothetical protein
MIVEISARQTGKTFRMLRHLTNHIVTGGHAVLVSHRYRNRRDHEKILRTFLTERYCEDNGLEYEILDSPYRLDLSSHDMDNLGPEWDGLNDWIAYNLSRVFFQNTMTQMTWGIGNTFYYVDEFCSIRGSHLMIMDNAYYCSTPHSYNNEANTFLHNLIRHCRDNDIEIKHVGPPGPTHIVHPDNVLYEDIVYRQYPFIGNNIITKNLVKYSPLKKLLLNVKSVL